MKRSLTSLIIAALLAGSSLTTGRQALAAPLRRAIATFEDNSIVVGGWITIYGPGASQELADLWQTWIEDTWNAAAAQATEGLLCYPVKFVAIVDYKNTVDKNDVPSGKGYDAWYIIKSGPGWHHRAYVTGVGDFKQDHRGVLTNNDSIFTVTHEAGHVFGLADQYDYATEQPLPGWETNIMGAYGGTIDAGNFLLILEAARRNGLLADAPTCQRLSLEMRWQMSAVGSTCGTSVNEVYGKATFPLLVSAEGALSGTGEGGLGHSFVVNDCPFWLGFETPYLYPITVSGSKTADGYAITLSAEDQSIAHNIDEKGQDRSQTVHMLPAFLPEIKGVSLGGTLASFILPFDAAVGEQFLFEMDYNPRLTLGAPFGGFHSVGSATLEVLTATK